MRNETLQYKFGFASMLNQLKWKGQKLQLMNKFDTLVLQKMDKIVQELEANDGKPSIVPVADKPVHVPMQKAKHQRSVSGGSDVSGGLP